MSIKSIVKLIISIAVCQFAGVIGSIFTRPSIPIWYAALQKPDFNPPDWIFAPVWIILYTLMGISAYIVLSKGFDKRFVKVSLMIFLFQLFLNALWSVLFFGFHSPLYAFIEIIILWTAITVVMGCFFKFLFPQVSCLFLTFSG